MASLDWDTGVSDTWPMLQFYFHQGQLMNSQRIVFIINTRVQCKEPQTSVLCIIDIACLIATVYFIIIRLVESFKLLFFIESVSGGRCRGCQRQRAIRAAGVSHKLLSLLPSLVGIALLFFSVCFALELLFANLYRRQGGRSCAGARVAPAEKFGLGRKF